MITTLRRQVIKQCPYRHETDVGELVVTLPGVVPELHDLAERVDVLTADPISHEDFTVQVLRELPPGSSVVTRWQTGPWSVEVQEGCSRAASAGAAGGE